MGFYFEAFILLLKLHDVVQMFCVYWDDGIQHADTDLAIQINEP